MIDRIMRRLWNSPWTQLVIALYCGWVYAVDKTWWKWVALSACGLSFSRFVSMGRKRWGSRT